MGYNLPSELHLTVACFSNGQLCYYLFTLMSLCLKYDALYQMFCLSKVFYAPKSGSPHISAFITTKYSSK
jgi:hypothetical protein